MQNFKTEMGSKKENNNRENVYVDCFITSHIEIQFAGTVETRSQKKPKWYSIHLCISCGLDRHHFGIPIEKNMTTTELHILRYSSMQLPWQGKEKKFGKLVR